MSETLQGTTLTPQTPQELIKAIGLAFDYRGDVTLCFHDGSKTDGFLYKFEQKENTVHLFVKTDPKTSVSHNYLASQIQSIAFTGEDHAFGKSWEEIQKKKAAQSVS